MDVDKFGRVDYFSPHTTMSIDKFGRHGVSTSTGKPSIGILLTEDGNYDMSNKIIKNVGEPKSSNDVVTRKYLESVTLTKEINTNQFNAKQSLIRNLLPPLMPGDAVTKGYGDNTYLTKNLHGHYNVNFKRIMNMRLPIEDTDAVSKEYVINRLNKYCLQRDSSTNYNAQGHEITNVQMSINPHPNDVVTKHFIDTCVLATPSWRHDDYDAKFKQIKNVGSPTTSGDVVTLDYFNSYSLRKKFDFKGNCSSWNVENGLLTNVKDPENMVDAVNLNYLVRCLSEISYWMYKQLASTYDNIKFISKSDWIKSRIVDPFFMNESTKIRSSNPSNS